MGLGSGFGKIILFGEHFVVYGAPAFAASISNTLDVEITPNAEEKFITELKINPEYTHNAISNILKSLESLGWQEKQENFLVNIRGSLPTYGGLGSSAAFSVAFARAINAEYSLGLDDEKINQHAYEGEKAFHGNPSGIDNTVATYGRIIQFRRGSTVSENKFEFIKLKKVFNIIVSFSGKYGVTSEMATKVKAFRESKPDNFENCMEEYLDISIRGLKALGETDLEELARLMNLNHVLLDKIGVADETNNAIVQIALKAGALGSKVTGGGGGGCCISLAKNEIDATEICKKIESAGYKSFTTTVG